MTFLFVAIVFAIAMHFIQRSLRKPPPAPRYVLEHNSITDEYRVVVQARYSRDRSGTLVYEGGGPRYFTTRAAALDYIDKLEADAAIHDSWKETA